MHIAIFISLVAAWPLVIGVALAITIALTAAEYEPQGNSLFPLHFSLWRESR